MNNVKATQFEEILLTTLPIKEREWLRLSLGLTAKQVSYPATLVSIGESTDPYLEAFMRDLYRKRQDIVVPGVDPDEEAKKLFVEREILNAKLNVFLPRLIQQDPELARFLQLTKKFVTEIVGLEPPRIFPEITSGATTTLERGNSVLERLCDGTTSKKLEDWLDSNNYQESDPWTLAGTGRVYGALDKAFTAPKTALISRFIAPAPTRVIAWQRGLGVSMAALYKRFGYDISTLGGLHGQLALEGSVHKKLDTTDITNSSNSVYVSLIRETWPTAWFETMLALRSDYIDLDGITHEYQMMGPNGNGFIFELQCITYLSMALAVGVMVGKNQPEYTSVFGDDIITPRGTTAFLWKMLKKVGIFVNEEKSFIDDSNIRESCGIIAYSGNNIKGTPLYEEPKDVHDWHILCNRIWDNYYDRDRHCWRSRTLRSIWLRCCRIIPHTQRAWGPESLGDATLHKRFWQGSMRWSKATSDTTDHCVMGWVLRYPKKTLTSFSKTASSLRASSQQQLVAAIHESSRRKGGSMKTLMKDGKKVREWKYSQYPDPRLSEYGSYCLEWFVTNAGVRFDDPIADTAVFVQRELCLMDDKFRFEVTGMRYVETGFEPTYLWNRAKCYGYQQFLNESPEVAQLMAQADHLSAMKVTEGDFDSLLATLA